MRAEQADSDFRETRVVASPLALPESSAGRTEGRFASPPRYYRIIRARWWLGAIVLGLLLWAVIAALLGVLIHA